MIIWLQDMTDWPGSLSQRRPTGLQARQLMISTLSSLSTTFVRSQDRASCEPHTLKNDPLFMLFVFCVIFSMLEQLGAGQFGRVYKGLWMCQGEALHVAVKVLHEEAEEGERVKFLQEAAVVGQFSHSNIIRLYGVVTINPPVSVQGGNTHTRACWDAHKQAAVYGHIIVCCVCSHSYYWSLHSLIYTDTSAPSD